MNNLPESTLNILIGGILGILSGLLNLVFNAFILWALKRDEMITQHKLDLIGKKQELLFKHQLEMKQKASNK